MKKVFIMLLLSLLVVSNVSAVDYSLALTSGVKQEFVFQKDSSTIQRVDTAPVVLSNLLRFSEKFAMAVDLGANVAYLDTGSSDSDSGFYAGISSSVNAYRVYNLSEKFDIYLGGGLAYDFDIPLAKSDSGIKVAYGTLGLCMDTRFCLKASDKWMLFSALGVGFDPLFHGSVVIGGMVLSVASGAIGVQWNAKLGVQYNF